LHRGLGFQIFHEGFPDKPGAVIFGHKHGDAEVNAEDILVVPAGEGIESVHEAVARPGFFAVGAADVAEHADAIIEEKRERAAGGAGNDAAVHGAKRSPLRGGPTPGGVALDVVGGADAQRFSL